MTVVFEVGDDPRAWAAAGFAVSDGLMVFANAVIKLSPGVDRGIVAVDAAGLVSPVAGLCFGEVDADAPTGMGHPNGVTAVDHVVATCSSVERTSEALMAAGLERRRTRVFGGKGRERRQDFFWLEDLILELTGPAIADSNDAPAAEFWGLALVCGDIDATKQFLGDLLGDPVAAVQPGRRISTLSTRHLDISVPVAVMSPHVARA